MFEKYKNKLKEKLDKLKQFSEAQYDVNEFDDPIAKKTEWHPLVSGGANFQTNSLVKVSNTVYRYQLSIGGKVFLSIFGLIGLVAQVIGIYMLLKTGEANGLFPLLFGLPFMGVSYYMYKRMGMPKVFDRSLGFLWIGHKQPKFSGDQKNSQELIYFNEIHAIQLLSERVSSSNNSYYSYEINLVMKDASRFNLVDHGKQSQILIDAQALSELLGKPIWNVIN